MGLTTKYNSFSPSSYYPIFIKSEVKWVTLYLIVIGLAFFATIQALEVAPVPEIKANGSDVSVRADKDELLAISVSLLADDLDGTNADWWVAASTPSGWYYYDSVTSWMFAGNSNAPLTSELDGSFAFLE